MDTCSHGSARRGTASHRQQATLGTTSAWESPSQPPAAPALGAQHGGCRSRSWTMTGQALEGYFSASSPQGLFAPPETSPQAQQELLMALNMHLTPQQRQQGEGTAGDGSISLEELTQTLQGLPRGKSPGFDGLPYEFYQRFWDQLGPELTAVLSEAFQAGAASLPADMTEGRVTLLYKGKGADRAQPASYRPITLLNTDYKLAARVIASRLGPLLNHVVDSTQTGFLPQRWIGDNILAHLETIDFHQHSQQPGVLLFLDFEKAFNRLDRPWMERCMAAVGFGAGAQRWVSLLHAGTTARAAFNGWHTARFPVQSGVFQGSPLSPLLFVLAVQPMAAQTRQLAAQQGLHALSTPLGQPATFIHCHADDTTIHAASPASSAGQAASLRALRTRSAAAEPVASPVLSPPSMRIRPPPLGRPACFCPGRYPATMPLPVDPQ